MTTTCWQRNSPLGFDCASVDGSCSEQTICRPEQLRAQQDLKRDPCAFHLLLIPRASGTKSVTLRSLIHNCGDGINSQSKKVTSLLLYSVLQRPTENIPVVSYQGAHHEN